MHAVIYAVSSLFAGDGVQPIAADAFEASVRPALETYCYECHAPDDPDNHVGFLAASTAADIQADRHLWASVAEQLSNRTMPPGDSTQPTEAERLEVARWVRETLRSTACGGGEAAPPVQTRRLNRTEYDATVQALFGLPLTPAQMFPGDGSGGEGFDNNGETLFLPPLLMEKYLTAAREVLDAAIVSPPLEVNVLADAMSPPGDVTSLSVGPSPDGTRPARQITVRRVQTGEPVTGVFVTHNEGVYTVAARIPLDGERSDDATLQLRLDGVGVGDFPVADLTDDGRGRLTLSKRVRLGRGQHTVGVHAVTGFADVQVLQAWGSKGDVPPRRIESHRRTLKVEAGERPEDPDAAARLAISDLMRRAFRTPVDEAEVDRFMTLYRRGRDRGDGWEESVKLAMTGVLVSPRFLFRVEPTVTDSGRRPLDDFALASRLSYFLWASRPDEELDALAAEGRLQDPDVLAAQVDRMLESPASALFAERFVGQWLGTHEIGGRFAPDTGKFKGQFDTPLLRDIREEPARFFRHLLLEDRPLTDLIDSDYAVLNDRLAAHYGYMAEEGEEPTETQFKYRKIIRKRDYPFRVIPLPDRDRGGLLGMGASQMISSFPNRTSPVLRGAWVLETMLGTKVPPPPPDVPTLKTKQGGKKLSVRESLRRHRDDPSCAACHNLMDPVGFALEGFDVLGRARGGEPRDLSATLPDGTTVVGPAGLKDHLMGRRDRFVEHLTSRLLGYALGRSLVDADDCTIRNIADAVIADGYSARTLVRQIVLSTPMRYVDPQPLAAAD